MLRNLSIRAKLLLLSGFFLSVLAINSALGMYHLGHQVEDVRALYNDRVVPLQQLKTFSDMYAVNIVDTAHKVRDGALTPQAGAAGGFGALAPVVGGLLIAAIVRTVARPLTAVEAADRIAAGDLTVQLSAHGRDETAQLLRAMAARTSSLRAVITGVRTNSLREQSAQLVQAVAVFRVGP